MLLMCFHLMRTTPLLKDIVNSCHIHHRNLKLQLKSLPTELIPSPSYKYCTESDRMQAV